MPDIGDTVLVRGPAVAGPETHAEVVEVHEDDRLSLRVARSIGETVLVGIERNDDLDPIHLPFAAWRPLADAPEAAPVAAEPVAVDPPSSVQPSGDVASAEQPVAQ